MDKEYMFEQLLSLEMTNAKIGMQILACLLTNEQFAEWKSAYDSIEKRYFEIIKQLHKENE